MLLCLAFVVGFGTFCGEEKDRVLFYSPTYCVGQDHLELRDPPTSTPQVSGLKAYTTIYGQIKHLQ